MATKVLLKKSSVASKIPHASDLDYGELALNYADGLLYYKNSANTVQSIGSSSTPPPSQYSPVSIDRRTYTATSGQTTFNVAYDITSSGALVQVFINGVLIDNSEYTSTNNTSIVFSTGANTGDLVECIGFSGGLSIDRKSYTATAGRTIFNITYDIVNANALVQVFINGVLIDSSEYDATANSHITLNNGTAAGDLVECIGFTGLSQSPPVYTSPHSNEYVLTGTTTDGSETEIFINGIANSRIPISSNTVLYYTADIVCKRTGSTPDYASFYVKGTAASSPSSVVSDVGSLYEVSISKTDASFAVDIRSDNTHKSANVYVTGAVGKTISWKCVITTVDV